MRTKSIHNLLLVLILAASIVISLPVLSFASTQAVNDAAANTKLTNIYNRLGNMYDRMAATNAYLSNIQTYSNNAQAYEYDIRNTLINYFSPIAGDTVNGSNRTISQQIYDLRQATYGVGSQTADVSSKLIYSNNYLSSIDSKTKDYTQYIDNIESLLDNNIDWIQFAQGQLVDLNENVITNTFRISNPSDYYFRYQINPTNNTGITRFDIPISQDVRYQNNFTFEFFIKSGTTIYPITFSDYEYVVNNQQIVELYIDNFSINGSYLYIKVIPNNSYYTFYNFADLFRGYYINSNNKDFLSVADYLYIKKMSLNVNKLSEIYASDDVIAAKQNQQAYEDQAITDFTGSGSAAASGSDTTNMKNVSGAIKSGLDSGGSVNGALGVFNTSGGLWDWFSQSNYNEINGAPTRGSGEYIDFYNTNREELERLLQEER